MASSKLRAEKCRKPRFSGECGLKHGRVTRRIGVDDYYFLAKLPSHQQFEVFIFCLVFGGPVRNVETDRIPIAEKQKRPVLIPVPYKWQKPAGSPSNRQV